MKHRINHFSLGMISIAVATLSACGGGGSGSATATGGTGTTVTAATTSVTTTVMDGLIRNALVCVDSNNNGMCDAGETQAHTDANGQVTLEVPTAALATTRLIAVAGTDATDADTGPVKTAYSMTAPAGKLAVISPLTTMVQTRMETANVSVEAAEIYVKSQTGLNVSMFDNFIAKRATSSEHKKAGDIARRLVLSIQKSKENSTSSTSSQCTSGLSSKEAEHVKETHINEGLIGNLEAIRKESDETENESDDDARKSAVVVPVCGAPATPAPAPTPGPTPAPTPTPTPAPAPSASPTTGKTLYAANCAACHGANPALNSNKILKGASSASTIESAISRNIGGMGFLSATIGAPQAADLAAYLATPSI